MKPAGSIRIAELPLWTPAPAHSPVAWRRGITVSLLEFRQQVAQVASRLPAGGAMINLCEDRYSFLVAYAAAVVSRHTVLMPTSRAEKVIAELQAAYPDGYLFDDARVETELAAARVPEDAAAGNLAIDTAATVPAAHTAMIGFTSGSTGQPQAFPKLWHSVSASTTRIAAAIRQELRIDPAARPWIVATVPPQHMYGMELSVLLPLLGGMAVHAGRPLFPADIAQALDEVPRPRLLVSTPVHLRALVKSSQEFPIVDLIVSATAPLDTALAVAVERKLGGKLLEMFGSTETCVFASRRTAIDAAWQLFEGVELQPLQDYTLVNAPWFTAPTPLQDVVEMAGTRRFVVRGRNTDLVEVAGKRASLADLTRRLLALEGVQDAVVFQPDSDGIATIRRVAALVVAPGLTVAQIQSRLAASVDSAFIPRPLFIIDALPRNELGKLPRQVLLAQLQRLTKP